MAVVIEKLNLRLMAGAGEFARAVWEFPDDRGFLSWLLAEPAGNSVQVAHDDGRWLAAIGGIAKVYLNAGQPICCYETYGWASLRAPEARGWGIKVMKALMDEGRPLIALGGSPDTLNYMPRLGFETLGQAPSMVLPLRGSFADNHAGLRRLLLKGAIPIMATLSSVRRHRRSPIRVQPMTRLDDATLSTPCLPGFQALPDSDFFRWQFGWPEQGTFVPLRFARGEEIVGWSFSRVAEEEPGNLTGRILEAKFAPVTTAVERAYMMGATARALAGFGVSAIRALTTCPDTNAALKSCRFMAGTLSPAMIYNPGNAVDPDQIFRVSVLRADGGVLPLRPNALALTRMGTIA